MTEMVNALNLASPIKICTKKPITKQHVVACSIENPTNGQVLPSTGQHYCGSTVTFTCNARYSLRGSNSSVCKCCQWDPAPPTCESKRLLAFVVIWKHYEICEMKHDLTLSHTMEANGNV